MPGFDRQMRFSSDRPMPLITVSGNSFAFAGSSMTTAALESMTVAPSDGSNAGAAAGGGGAAGGAARAIRSGVGRAIRVAPASSMSSASGARAGADFDGGGSVASAAATDTGADAGAAAARAGAGAGVGTGAGADATTGSPISSASSDPSASTNRALLVSSSVRSD